MAAFIIESSEAWHHQPESLWKLKIEERESNRREAAKKKRGETYLDEKLMKKPIRNSEAGVMVVINDEEEIWNNEMKWRRLSMAIAEKSLGWKYGEEEAKQNEMK